MPPSRRGWTSFGSDMWLTAGSIGPYSTQTFPARGHRCSTFAGTSPPVRGGSPAVATRYTGASLRATSDRMSAGSVELRLQRRARADQAVPTEVGDGADGAAPASVGGSP